MSDEYTKLIEGARRAEAAVYLATEDAVAQDISRIIKGLADALRAQLPEVWYEGFEAGATFVDHTPSGVSVDPPLNPYEKPDPTPVEGGQA